VPPTPTPKPAPPASDGTTIAAIAQRYLGYRYVWGGTSPATGFDCSGFVFYVYRQAGKYLPRDLWGQLNAGPRISRNNLQPGDIVFFQNTYTTGLSHNGIYLGGGRFIHAATERTGVIISRLDDPYWGPRYVGASRP
jgi:cell wall-associated NlpC family hydrolase